MVLSNDSSLLMDKSPGDWALKRQDGFVADLIKAELPVDKQMDALKAAKARLKVYEENLLIAQEFAKVDQPLISIAEDQEMLELQLDEEKFDAFAEYFAKQDLSEARLAKGVAHALAL